MENKECLYNEAIKMIEKSDYLGAYNNLRRCGKYKNTKELLGQFKVICDKCTSFTYDADGNIAFKDECYYDENGNETLYVSYDADGNIEHKETHKYEYDENRNTTLCVCYDEDGNEDCRYGYEYDKNGNRTIVTRENTDNSKGTIIPVERYEFKYDECGNVILEVGYDANGNIINEIAYEYDENGNKILATATSKRWKSNYNYEYDQNGNCMRESCYDSEGKIKSNTEYKYDENGNKTFEVFYDESGRVTAETKCKYDHLGNVIIWHGTNGENDSKVVNEYINPRVIYKPKNK